MAKKSKKIDLIETIICDQIEAHDNGKFSLIGLYPKDITISKIPAPLIVSLWLNFSIQTDEEIKIEIKISGKDVLDKETIVPVTINNDQTMKNTGIAVPLILKNITLNIQNEGIIAIHYKTAKSKWKAARQISINKPT